MEDKLSVVEQRGRLAAQLGELLKNKNYTVTCAESCTGGGIASAITDISGSSQWFRTGFVTYAAQSKQQLLGVPSDVLASKGEVSRDVVELMAIGALKSADAEVAVAVSGIAGPDGGSAEKPVGLVWFAWAIRGDKNPQRDDESPQRGGESPQVESQSYQFKGSRTEVRAAAIEQALVGLVVLLKK